MERPRAEMQWAGEGRLSAPLAPEQALTRRASLWYLTAFLVSATARSTKPTDWSMLFSIRSIMAPFARTEDTMATATGKRESKRQYTKWAFP